MNARPARRYPTIRRSREKAAAGRSFLQRLQGAALMPIVLGERRGEFSWVLAEMGEPPISHCFRFANSFRNFAFFVHDCLADKKRSA